MQTKKKYRTKLKQNLIKVGYQTCHKSKRLDWNFNESLRSDSVIRVIRFSR